MSSQFEKRKAKSTETVTKEIEDRRAEIRSRAEPEVTPVVEPVYTQTGLDIYTTDGGKTYGVAQISYNPETGDAKVVETFGITRLVALTYAQQKLSLGSLKKSKK